MQIHRIPHGRDNSTLAPGKTRPVVFVQHGLEGDSSNWVISYDNPEKSLGMYENDFKLRLRNFVQIFISFINMKLHYKLFSNTMNKVLFWLTLAMMYG